jgi:hypothetical protein
VSLLLKRSPFPHVERNNTAWRHLENEDLRRMFYGKEEEVKRGQISLLLLNEKGGD